MFRFFLTRSGRCYLLQETKLFTYEVGDEKWNPTDRTMENLLADGRTVEVDDEDAFKWRPRQAFRRQFQTGWKESQPAKDPAHAGRTAGPGRARPGPA